MVTDNASSGTVKRANPAKRGADNQQATNQFCEFYYTGFCVGEMSCSLIRATNRKSKGFYFTPDLTISNADLGLLREVNRAITSSVGIISPIKGGYNLSFRGRRKVEAVLQFFEKFPVIAGDIAQRKLELLESTLPAIGKYSKVLNKAVVVEELRKGFKDLKRYGFLKEESHIARFDNDAIGFFLAGIIDAEGSCGLKKSGLYRQPFFAVAMKDRKIIELVKSFLNCGHIHLRSDDGLFHWEVGSKADVLKVIKIFTDQYSSRLPKMKDRMQKLRRSLNDYTLSPD